jgi:hypothetical protein
MANPRTPIDELEFFKSPNLKRALSRAPEPQLQKRGELEAMFADVLARRDEALADVKVNGMVILQDKFSARGELYTARVINPALKIAQQCERQLAQLAKLLTASKPERRGNKSVEDLLAEAEALIQ